MRLNAPPSYETRPKANEGTMAYASAWSANIDAVTADNTDLTVTPYLHVDLKVIEKIDKISIQGLDACVAPQFVTDIPDLKTTDCGNVAEWYIVWFNGEKLLGFNSAWIPFEVKQGDTASKFWKKTCGTDPTALCDLDLSDNPITAKSVTIYITKTNKFHPFMRVGIFAKGNPLENAKDARVNKKNTHKVTETVTYTPGTTTVSIDHYDNTAPLSGKDLWYSYF